MILVEGPDGAGKSTLCDEICKKFDLDLGERGTKNRDKLYEVTRMDTRRAMGACVLAYTPPRVWDRLGPISDPIYAPLGDRKPAFSDDYIRRFYRFLDLFRVPVFICLPPLETVRENVVKGHQMDGVTQNINQIFNSYCSVAMALTHYGCNVHIYSYKIHSLEPDAAPQIRHYLQRRKDREC